MAVVPPGVKTVFGRADWGFYCWQAVEAYEGRNWQFIIVARKTKRLMDELKAAEWKPSPCTDADEHCEFPLSAGGLGQGLPVPGAAYRKKPEANQPEQPEQYQFFDTPEYTYRVFVMNMERPLDALVRFYNQRAGRRT